MLPKFLDGRGADAFGKEIADDIRKAVPLEATRGPKAGAKRAQKLARTVEKASGRSKTEGYNFYQRAKFGNALRWSLKDAGYAPDFVQEVVTLILARM